MTARSASAACWKDLADQRDSLVGQAEQVRNVISGLHLDLTHDITAVGDRVAETVNEVAPAASARLCPIAARTSRWRSARPATA